MWRLNWRMRNRRLTCTMQALTCSVSALGLSCEFGGAAQLREPALAGYVEGVPTSVGVA